MFHLISTISNFLDLKLMSFQLLPDLWKTEIYFAVLLMFYGCFFEFQNSLWFDGESNYLQKFDNCNRGLLFFLINKNNCISYYSWRYTVHIVFNYFVRFLRFTVIFSTYENLPEPLLYSHWFFHFEDYLQWNRVHRSGFREL